jgi:hypothetical protein
MVWKIRRGELWSNGVIAKKRWNEKPTVMFSKKGKEWTSEKLVKAHLLKWLLAGNSIPKEWEIIEVVYAPTRPMEEWLDANMTFLVLKNAGQK